MAQAVDRNGGNGMTIGSSAGDHELVIEPVDDGPRQVEDGRVCGSYGVRVHGEQVRVGWPNERQAAKERFSCNGVVMWVSCDDVVDGLQCSLQMCHTNEDVVKNIQ